MDKELQMHGYELTVHEITKARLIKLNNEQGKTLLIVPMEMFAVTTFFRCVFEQKKMSVPAHKMFLDVMNVLGGKLCKVVIDDLQGGNFFATMHYTNHKGEMNAIKAEASDALVMAFCAPCLVFIKASIIDAAKNDRLNRVYWYDPEDEESLREAKACSHEELVALPSDDVEQLIEIATNIEDFEFAARLKKARDFQNKKIEQMREIIHNAIAEDPEKFVKDIEEQFKKSVRRRK
jgi:bifunctional DNase/RNase